jgi:hypothetical protein
VGDVCQGWIGGGGVMHKEEIYQKIEQIIRDGEGTPILAANEIAELIDHPYPATEIIIMFAMIAVRVIEWEKQAKKHTGEAESLRTYANLLRNLATM